MRKAFVIISALLIAATAFCGRADRTMNKGERKSCQNYLKWLQSFQASIKEPNSWLQREMKRNKNNPEQMVCLTEIQNFGDKNREVLAAYEKTIKDALKINTYRAYYSATLADMERDILGKELDLLKHYFYRAGTLQHRSNLCSRYSSDPKKLKLTKEILNLEIEHWDAEIEYREKILETRKRVVESYKKRTLRIPDIEDILYKK